MALTRANGNYMTVEGIQNKHATLSVYKSEEAFNAYQESPTEENTPQRIGFYVGEHFDTLKAETTSLDGLTMEQKEMQLMEQALLDSLNENYAGFPRTKFETNEWDLVQ